MANQKISSFQRFFRERDDMHRMINVLLYNLSREITRLENKYGMGLFQTQDYIDYQNRTLELFFYLYEQLNELYETEVKNNNPFALLRRR